MKRYSVLIAYDVPCYATVIVEANNHEEANAKALAMADDTIFEPCWDGSDDYRVADAAMELDANGKPVNEIVEG